MKRRRNLFQTASLMLALLLCVTSCAPTLTINNSYDREAIFQTYQTYAWYAPSVEPVGGIATDAYSDQLDLQIKAAVESALVKEGLRPATETADIYIAYDIALDTEAEIPEGAVDPTFGYGYSYRNGYRYDYNTADLPGYRTIDSYLPGTIIVDIVDASTNTLVWRGWADTAIKSDYTEKDITRIITAIMAQYPPEISRMF